MYKRQDVHIGTDEYNLKEAEQFRYFTEYYLKYITKYGKNPRLWGSLKHMKGNTPVNLKGKTVNAWNYSWLDLETALQEGAKAINTCDAFLYIVPAVNYYHNFLDHQWIYAVSYTHLDVYKRQMERNSKSTPHNLIMKIPCLTTVSCKLLKIISRQPGY